jgi:CRP-like cAMP-binding protein
VFDSMNINKKSLDFMTSVGDGRRVSKNLNRSTNKIRRRMGISAAASSAAAPAEMVESVDDDSGDSEGAEVVHERATIEFLAGALSKHFLFTSVTLDTLEEVCKHMRFVQTPAGSNIIEQGQNGTSFYVVDSGEFKVVMKSEGRDEVKVLNTLRRGQCFGESVLMTRNLKRMATVRAVVDCGSWVVHRRVYEEKVLAKSAGSHVEEFLKGVDIFYRLAPAVVRGIAARCESLELPPSTTLFEQGDYSDDMYFIVKGTVAVISDGRELATLTTRDAFGEGSILAGKGRRTAGVVTRSVTSLLKLPAAIMAKLLPLGLDEVLDEKLALQVLKSIPGFAKLTEQMLRDCGVTENKHLQDAVLRSITLEPGALVAEERKPADAIFIIKRGGLMVTTRRQQKLGTQPRLLSERAYFGTAAAIADGTYHETAVATEVGGGCTSCMQL